MRPGQEGCSVCAEDSGSFLSVFGQPVGSVSRAGWLLGLPQFHLRFHALCAGADTEHGHFLVSYGNLDNYQNGYDSLWQKSGLWIWILLNPHSCEQCCGSGMFMPDPGSEFFYPDPGSRSKRSRIKIKKTPIPDLIKKIKVFLTQKTASKLSKKLSWTFIPDPGSGSQIRIPDPGIEKAPDPGFGSAKLYVSCWVRFYLGRN
jgi:hypothetical protein